MDNAAIEILLIDDNESELCALTDILNKGGYQARGVTTGRAGIEILEKKAVDLLVTDLQLPDMNGMEILKSAKALKPDCEVLLITAFGTVQHAVEALKFGAYDFIEKPVKKYRLLKIIEKACEKQQLLRRNLELTRLIDEITENGHPIGKSPNFTHALELASQVAPSEATIMVRGESGTGKELFADFIQKNSSRRKGPFIKFNCAAIPESLLESELFGYEKGAFTGALGNKPGRFELAHQGTVFLDEVGEMSPSLQAKLLRVLENGEFQRVGGTKTIRSDVRILAATNSDLKARVTAKTFREDLYYRLNVVEIVIPPLRERPADIPLLAVHFLEIYNRKNKGKIKGFKKDALACFEKYAWPGNVRELENAVERAVVVCKGGEIGMEDLPGALTNDSAEANYLMFPIGTALEDVERRMIDATLKFARGNKKDAARLLKTSVRTLYRKNGSHE